MKKYGVIMAGGGGTRFWPLSREKKPKQLLNLTGTDFLVNEAIDRIAAVIPNENIFVVTSAVQAPDMLEVTANRICKDHVLAEPAARNTAACIGYAAMEIVKKYGDGVMIITPADHYIKDVEILADVFRTAIQAAEESDKLITIGIQPTFPSTGFGYIKYEATAQASAKSVFEFREKPDLMTAKRYVESGEYLWNSGMFIWKASVILQKFENYIPDIYADIQKLGDAMGTPEETAVLKAVYPNIRKLSIDYAVMEPSAGQGDVLVIPGHFGWNDVGSLDMMDVLHDADENGNVLIGDALAVHASNSIVYSGGRLVAALGVDNLIIVETPDAILVCNKDKAQDVKYIVDALKDTGRTELL